MTAALVKVRTLREHNGPEGMKVAGDEYQRTKEDAEQLVARGIVELATARKQSGRRRSE